MFLNSFVHTRRDFLKAGSILAAGSATPWIAAYADVLPVVQGPVCIGYLPTVGAIPLLVAHHRGLFDAEGVSANRPLLFNNAFQLLDAFASGRVNVIHLEPPMDIWARYHKKLSAKIVAWAHVGGSGLTVAPWVADIHQLEGMSVAVPTGYSIQSLMAHQFFRSHDLLPSQTAFHNLRSGRVNLIDLQPSEMPLALASKRIAGYIVSEPYNSMAEELGVGHTQRFSRNIWRDHASSVVCMNEFDLNLRPDWSQKVVNAIASAELWIRNNRNETISLVAIEGADRCLPYSRKLLTRMLISSGVDQAKYLSSGAILNNKWNGQGIDFQPYPFPSYTEQVVKQLKLTLKDKGNTSLGSLNPQFVARDLIDERFISKSIEAMGGLKPFGLPNSFERSETFSS